MGLHGRVLDQGTQREFPGSLELLFGRSLAGHCKSLTSVNDEAIRYVSRLWLH